MKIAITGTTGLVGRWIAAAARDAGHEVSALSRPAYTLGDAPDLTGHDALIHAAFRHAPGRYRGGEGDDPQGFIRDNLDGSLRLFEAARDTGVARVLFLSSRAVFDGYPEGADLTEELPPQPTSLYGEVKARTEAALDDMATTDFRTASLRATGVFGHGQPQKWTGLIRDFLGDRPVPSRVSTEVHGADLAAAALLVLGDPRMHGAYHASDIILDHHDLLAGVASITQSPRQPPSRADARDLRVLNTHRLDALGWQPDGWGRLHADLAVIIDEARRSA